MAKKKKKRTNHIYKEGDEIIIKNFNHADKTDPLYTGLFTVTRVDSKNQFVEILTDTLKKEKLNINNIITILESLNLEEGKMSWPHTTRLPSVLRNHYKNENISNSNKKSPLHLPQSSFSQ